MIKQRRNFKFAFAFKIRDFALTLDKQSHGRTLYAASTLAARDFLPDNWAELETNNTIKYLSSLLCGYDMRIDCPRIFYRSFNSAFCDLVENDSFGISWL